MKLCILENDTLAPEIRPQYGGYGAMFIELFRKAGATDGSFDVFHTPSGEYPKSYSGYDAVLLTGSQADAFSTDTWVLTLRAQVIQLLEEKKKMLGVCFGHQLIALCLGACVARSHQGWGVGCTAYDWNPTNLPLPPYQSHMALLASHQDQVLDLPPQAQLLASNAHCPVAAYTVGNEVFCVQGHPEFVPEYSAFLLGKRRMALGEDRYIRAIQSLTQAHDGLYVARMMLAFVENR
jgi:GMP synthase-like glutamine amidotransferase